MKSKGWLAGLALAATATATSVAYAQNGTTSGRVANVGHGQGYSYFQMQSMPSQCGNNPMFVHPSMFNESELTRVMSTVTAAHLAGRPLTLVAFNQSGTGPCMVTRVEF